MQTQKPPKNCPNCGKKLYENHFEFMDTGTRVYECPKSKKGCGFRNDKPTRLTKKGQSRLIEY